MQRTNVKQDTINRPYVFVDLFVCCLSMPKQGLSGDATVSDGSSFSDSGGAASEPAGEASSVVVPWLELLHVWVHNVASRDERLRRWTTPTTFL